MIISGGRNYIFVHIPKTGGTALALALEARAKADDIMLGDTPKAVKRRKRVKDVQAAGRLWKHSTLADIVGLIPQEQIKNSFTFTLVRNPWDRLVSYYHWLREQSFDHPAVTLAQAQPFSGFLNHQQTRAAMIAMPYARYMQDAQGVEHCSAYIRIENFTEDVAPLEAHLGFSLQLDRVNASIRDADYRRYYSGGDSQLVAEICAQDIARFGYSY